MNDQEMRLRCLELAASLIDAPLVNKDGLFAMAEELFVYAFLGNAPDLESNGGKDGEKNN